MTTYSKNTFHYLLNFLIFLLIPIITKCDVGPSVSERVKMISSIKPKDPYLTIFYDYLKANSMVEALVYYEDALIAQKKLQNTSLEAYKNYFFSLSKMTFNELGERCASLDSINTEKLHRGGLITQTAEYKNYVKAAGEEMKNTSLAFRLIRIAEISGMPDLLAMVNHILEQNDLTEETKYYYLFYQMPWKRCQ